MNAKKKDNNYKPIFCHNADDMEKPLSMLMDELRSDISVVRGKLFDIKKTYGWDDRIDFLEGGLTCMIVAMSYTQKEWYEFERKNDPQPFGIS